MTFFPQQGYQGYGSPESIARKRRLAEQLMQGVARTPRNVGEGLSALGNALAVRGINSRADEAETAMREGFARDYGDIFNPQAGVDVAGDTVAALGLDVQPEAAASPSYQRVLAALADPRGGASQRAALQAMLPSLMPMSAADKTKFDYMKMKDERDYSRDVLESDRTYGLQSSAAARAAAAEARAAADSKWVQDGAGRWRNKETGEYRFDVPPSRKAPTVQRLKLSDGSEVAVQWDESRGDWVPINAPQGGGTAPPRGKLTESQSKLTLFESLQTETQPVLMDLEDRWNPANVPDAIANRVIGGNFFKSEEGQIYAAAAGQWAEGALRIATGAAATPEEMERTVVRYFAQPGDTPRVVRFKSELRKSYERAIQRALGNNPDGRVPLPSEFEKDKQPPQGAAGPPPAGVTQEEWDNMDDKDRALWPTSR